MTVTKQFFGYATAVLAAGMLAAPVRAGSYQYGNMLLMRDVIPGTEQVTLIPGGDFETAGGRPAGWGPKTGWNGFTVGPHILPAPGCCGDVSVYIDVARGGGSQQINDLPSYDPNWRVIFSGYAWLPNVGRIAPCATAPGEPGAQHICMDWPVVGGDEQAMANGFYWFGDVRPRNADPKNHPQYNIKGGCFTDDEVSKADRAKLMHRYGWWDEKKQWHTAFLAGDNLGSTPAVAFAPPMLRYEAAHDFLAALAAERRLSHAGEPEALDVHAAVAGLGAMLKDNPRDAAIHNAMAAGCIVQFARDLEDYEACKRALAAWKASLEIQPDQPLVRHWVEQFSGYVPPKPFKPAEPPQEALDASDRAAAQMDPAWQQATILHSRDAMLGTQRVRLAPGGDFEGGLAAWTVEGKGFDVLSVKGADQTFGIAPLRGNFLCLDSPIDAEASALSEPMDLPAGQYVISAYLSPADCYGKGALAYVTIGFDGHKKLFWGLPARHSWTMDQGIYVFTTVTLEQPISRGRLRIAAVPQKQDDNEKRSRTPGRVRGANGKDRPVVLIVDEVAVTPAAQFRPPVLRPAAQMMFWRMLAFDATAADATQADELVAAAGKLPSMDAHTKGGLALARRNLPGDLARCAQQLDAAAKLAPNNAAAQARLAAGCMTAFLRDPARTALQKRALEAWDASLAIDADQPAIRMLRDLWGRYEGHAREGVYAYAHDNPPQCVISPAGGSVAEGDKVEVSIAMHAASPILEPYELRYTVDGSVPNPQSPLYEKPFSVDKTTTVRASAFRSGARAKGLPVAEAKFVFGPPRQPDKVNAVQPGLACEYVEGGWFGLKGAFESGKTKSALASTAPGLIIPALKRKHDVMVIWTGFLEVQRAGTCLFHFSTPGNVKFWIGDADVLSLDGFQQGPDCSVAVALCAGRHAVKLAWFNGAAMPKLQVLWEGPGIEKQAIAAELWSKPGK